MDRTTRKNYPIYKEFLNSLPAPMIDEVSAQLTYRGYAELGAGYGEAKWLIVRETKANAAAPHGLITTEYASGSMEFDQVWANRASLTYSR